MAKINTAYMYNGNPRVEFNDTSLFYKLNIYGDTTSGAFSLEALCNPISIFGYSNIVSLRITFYTTYLRVNIYDTNNTLYTLFDTTDCMRVQDVNSLADINSLTRYCMIRFKSSVTMGNVTVPTWAIGVHGKISNDGFGIFVDLSLNLFVAYKNSGNWSARKL